MIHFGGGGAAVIELLRQHRRQFLADVPAVGTFIEDVLGVFGAERAAHVDLRQIKAARAPQFGIDLLAIVFEGQDLGIALDRQAHGVAQGLRPRAVPRAGAHRQQRSQRHAGA